MNHRIFLAVLGFAALAVGCDAGSGPKATGEGSTSRAKPTATVAASGSRGLAQPGTERPSDTADRPTAEPESAESWCAPLDPTIKPMLLLKFRFSSAVKRREPVDKLNITRPGQRVYAHLTVRNRSGRRRCLHVEFRVNGKRRTKVTLKVGESWSWRTWAYNTSRSDDRGPLELSIRDDQGNVFLYRRLAIVPESATAKP